MGRPPRGYAQATFNVRGKRLAVYGLHLKSNLALASLPKSFQKILRIGLRDNQPSGTLSRDAVRSAAIGRSTAGSQHTQTHMKTSTMSIIGRLEAVRPGFVLIHPDLPGWSVSASDAAGLEEWLETIVSTDEFNRTGSTTFRAPGSRRKTTLTRPHPKN